MAEFLLSAFADEAGGGLLDQIAALKENGLTHIEPRGLDEGNISNFTAAQAKEVKKVLDANGIGVSSIGSHFGKINIRDDFTAHFESFKQCVENACILGTPNIRMFSFYMPEGEDPAVYRDEVFARLEQMADYARKVISGAAMRTKKGSTAISTIAALISLQPLRAKSRAFSTLPTLSSATWRYCLLTKSSRTILNICT